MGDRPHRAVGMRQVHVPPHPQPDARARARRQPGRRGPARRRRHLRPEPASAREPRRIGMVFQKPNPFPAMSIRENVLAGLALTGRRPGEVLTRTTSSSGACAAPACGTRFAAASTPPAFAAVAALAILAANGGGWVRAAAVDPFDVEVRDARGRSLRLAEFKGKIVLVDLWASWCPDCRISFPALDALSREYRPRGVEIVAVNVDQRQKDAAAFLAVHPHEMVVVFDPRARMLEAFGAAGIPSSYLIDRQGTVRYRHSGYRAGPTRSIGSSSI